MMPVLDGAATHRKESVLTIVFNLTEIDFLLDMNEYK